MFVYFIAKFIYILILTKNGLGHILGEFLTNLPGTDVMILKKKYFFAEKFRGKNWRFDSKQF
jgi:hypothetical protein